MKKSVNEKYKYNQLISVLRHKILNGDYDEAGKLPPERKLAEEFGYSRITIRTAIQELKEDGLIHQKQGSGNFITARKEKEPAGQVGMAQKHIALVITKPPLGLTVEEDPYGGQIILGALKAKNSTRNFDIIPLIHDERHTLQQTLEEAVGNGQTLDGLLIGYHVSSQDVRHLRQQGRPFVMLGETQALPYLPTVAVDNYRGAYQATQHLIDTGCKTPIWVDTQFATSWGEKRQSGFRQALLDSGLPFEDSQLVQLPGKDAIHAKKAVLKLLKQDRSFDAVVICGDWPTLGAMDAFAETGIRIPADVSLINYDGYTWLFRSVRLPLTHVTQPFVAIGTRAMQMLYEAYEQPSEAITQVFIPPTLVLGESTQHPRRLIQP